MDSLEHAGRLAGVFTALAAAGGLVIRLMRTPIAATHRYYGKLAWAAEIEQAKEARSVLLRIEPEVDILRRDVSEIKDKIDTIFGVLLDRGVPGGDYNPSSRPPVRGHHDR